MLTNIPIEIELIFLPYIIVITGLYIEYIGTRKELQSQHAERIIRPEFSKNCF